ncbi:MAG: hypothetical protein WBA88_25330 [Pseudaminobacter sp.]
MDAFAAATDAVFADPNIARGAIWRPGGTGSGMAVRVATRQPDQVVGFGDSRAILSSVLIDVRQSDVASPVAGDVVMIGADVFEIIAPPTIDSLQLVWTCEAARQS